MSRAAPPPSPRGTSSAPRRAPSDRASPRALAAEEMKATRRVEMMEAGGPGYHEPAAVNRGNMNYEPEDCCDCFCDWLRVRHHKSRLGVGPDSIFFHSVHDEGFQISSYLAMHLTTILVLAAHTAVLFIGVALAFDQLQEETEDAQDDGEVDGRNEESVIRFEPVVILALYTTISYFGGDFLGMFNSMKKRGSLLAVLLGLIYSASLLLLIYSSTSAPAALDRVSGDDLVLFFVLSGGFIFVPYLLSFGPSCLRWLRNVIILTQITADIVISISAVGILVFQANRGGLKQDEERALSNTLVNLAFTIVVASDLDQHAVTILYRLKLLEFKRGQFQRSNALVFKTEQ